MSAWAARQRNLGLAAGTGKSRARGRKHVLRLRSERGLGQRPGGPLQHREVGGVVEVEVVVVRFQRLAQQVLRGADGVDALDVDDPAVGLRPVAADQHPVQPLLDLVPDVRGVEVDELTDRLQHVGAERALREVGQVPRGRGGVGVDHGVERHA